MMMALIILSGCQKNERQTDLTIESVDNQTYNIPQGYADKKGYRGDFYYDFENFILVINEINQDNIEEQIHQSLNYYLPGEISLSEDLKINISNQQVKIERYTNSYKLILGKILDNEIVLLSSKNESTEDLYEKVLE